MLFCHIDSKVKGRPHATLRKDKGLLGLPSLAFLDANGQVLLQVPPDARTVEGLRRTGARAQEYVGLRKAAAAGDDKATTEFLIMQLEERQVLLTDARARDAKLKKVTPQQRKHLDELLLNLQISTVARAAGGDRKKRRATGKRFLKMLKDGPRPNAHVGRGFWFFILEHAEAEKDIASFRLALNGMREALAVTDPGKPWVKNLLKRYEEILSRLEAERKSR